MADTVFGFKKDDATKITALIDKTGKKVRPKNQDPPYGPTQFLAYTTSTITARVGTTVGSGTATLKRIDTTTLVDHGAPIEITAYNILTVEVAVGEYIMLGKEYGSGKWIVHLAGCD